MHVKLGDVITQLQSRDCKPLGFLIGKALQGDNDVGDFLIVRIWRFWWHQHCMFVASFQCKALVANDWPSTSGIYWQHKQSLTSVTNIEDTAMQRNAFKSILLYFRLSSSNLHSLNKPVWFLFPFQWFYSSCTPWWCSFPQNQIRHC